MKSHEFNYGLSKLTIEGAYYKGTNGDYFNPPEPTEFEIHKVYVQGELELVDVTDLLENMMVELEQYILNKYYE